MQAIYASKRTNKINEHRAKSYNVGRVHVCKLDVPPYFSTFGFNAACFFIYGLYDAVISS